VPAISARCSIIWRRHSRASTSCAGISPGNRFDLVPATAESISALGKPFGTRRDGAPITVHGWQGLSRHAFPTIGTRWLGYCNVPDLALFAERYQASTRSISAPGSRSRRSISACGRYPGQVGWACCGSRVSRRLCWRSSAGWRFSAATPGGCS
jgi:hypothetical protein